MPSRVEQHSHRSTTKVSHKPFKSRKSTKGALKDLSKGRVPDFSHRKTAHQQVMSKFDRRNQARQKQQTKHREHLRDTNVFAGKDSAPRIVTIISLCEDGEPTAAVRAMCNSVDVEANVPPRGHVLVEVDRFKQKLQFILPSRDLTACLDAAKVADVVICILSSEKEVDDLGELILRSVESQGLSTLFTVVQGLDRVGLMKRKTQIVSSLRSYITHFHPEQEKIHNLDARQECANLMRSLCTLTPKGVKWREERSWMFVDEVQWPKMGGEKVILTGFIRGKGLKADRLVQVGDWGEFQIDKITAAPLESRKRKANDMEVDLSTETVLQIPTVEQDDLIDLAPESAIMMEDDASMSVVTNEKRGVLLDDHHYFSDDETHLPARPKRLPRGTSAYQAAWYLGEDFSDSGSDMEDVTYPETTSINAPALPQDGLEGFAPKEPTEAAPTEYPVSEMFLDPRPDDAAEAEQLAAFRTHGGDAAKNDKDYPDEIELHPNVLARERLSRFRGLKSLRTSPWEETEDRAHEPEDWRRMLQVPNYKASRSQATRETLVGGLTPGTRVHVHLRNAPGELEVSYDPLQPLHMFSLLRHEHKRVAANVSILVSSDYPNAIKSKEDIIMQCGPRRFVINPVFSQTGSTPNDVHKYERFLHPGASAIASFVAPLTWGSVPVLFFKRDAANPSNQLTLIGTGTSLPPSSSRIIVKRVILTGHPYKIHKKLVTIRYMFFNREDVEWFKALQLWTKRGRSGYIKESLGTHGYFKATFDGRINPQDSIGVSLYKRVWPKAARLWSPKLEKIVGQETEDTAMEEAIL